MVRDQDCSRLENMRTMMAPQMYSQSAGRLTLEVPQWLTRNQVVTLQNWMCVVWVFATWSTTLTCFFFHPWKIIFGNMCSIYWECHHPNWRTPSFFQRGRLNHQPGWASWFGVSESIHWSLGSASRAMLPCFGWGETLQRFCRSSTLGPRWLCAGAPDGRANWDKIIEVDGGFPAELINCRSCRSSSNGMCCRFHVILSLLRVGVLRGH